MKLNEGKGFNTSARHIAAFRSQHNEIFTLSEGDIMVRVARVTLSLRLLLLRRTGMLHDRRLKYRQEPRSASRYLRYHAHPTRPTYILLKHVVRNTGPAVKATGPVATCVPAA